MSYTKFTPGPWNVEHPFQEPGVYVGGPRTELVCKLYPLDDVAKQRGENIEANAALIAAAPDMYAACEPAEVFLRDIGSHSKALSMVRAALRKARGEA